jgi:hypothetical protein
MNGGSPPPGWMGMVTKAAWTLLLVAAIAFVVWQFFLRPLLPALLVIVGLVFVIRLAVGWFHRDGW